MTVKELIEELKEYEQELDIELYIEGESSKLIQIRKINSPDKVLLIEGI